MIHTNLVCFGKLFDIRLTCRFKSSIHDFSFSYYFFKKEAKQQRTCYTILMIITRAQPNLNCFKLSECLDYTRTIHTYYYIYIHNRAHSLSKLNTEEAKPNTVKKKSTQQYY